MSYKFYGSNTKSIKPINRNFAKILDQRNLYDILSEIWCKETCAPRMQDEWNEQNKTLGQCSITAFLVQDIFGGDVYGIPLEYGNFHCFNKIGDIVFDLTSEQFGERKLNYNNVKLQSREEHFSKKEKYHRYLYLKEKLIDKINEL